MFKIKIVGKFYDNHSLSIINRYLALELAKVFPDSVCIEPIDEPNYLNKVSLSTLSELKKLESDAPAEIEIRHSYPIKWNWPSDNNTKVIYIQPWEFMAMPSEWQYKFDTFADAIITPSRWTANVYESAGINPHKIHVIPNGYNPEVFYNRNTDKETKTFLFVGCNQFRKGVDILLNAWANATKLTDNVKLIIKDTPSIYGRTSLQQDIIKLQYNSKCGRIEYDDANKSETDMAELYSSCTYIVHPYRGEGFGMHLQEAEACGVIPIVSQGGPADEFLTKPIFINTGRRVVNVYDIFALKPGDSMSHMGQHRWVLEPDVNHLTSILNKLAASNVTIDFPSGNDNTWENIAKEYVRVITSVQTKKPERVR
jgi:glycosyltransferase involved in cell wall biosynthesis